MDELEISGKRYISTRRAAKEYKYHSDYIGQLIRGKKLVGRKVGRSWYVELDSVTEYFDKEGVVIPQGEVVAKTIKEEVVVAPVAVMPIVVEAPAIAQTPVVEEKPEIISERDSIHIPIRVRRPSFETAPVKKFSTLTYVSDEEPYIPMTRRVNSTELPASVVMPRTEEEAEEISEEIQIEEKTSRSTRSTLTSIFGVLVLGVLALVIVMGSSILISSHTVIEAGKAASVGYTLR